MIFDFQGDNLTKLTSLDDLIMNGHFDVEHNRLDELEDSELIVEPIEEILRAEPIELASMSKEEFENSFFMNNDTLFEAYYAAVEEKKKGVILYYTDEKNKIEEVQYYIFAPDSVRIVRASAAEMGNGVLGLAYTGMGLVKILDTLHGADYDEVLKHELNHVKYPNKSEWEIRRMTKEELGGNCKYH